MKRFHYGVLVVWPALWLGLLCNLAGILCLGYYVPSWDVSYMFWAGRKFVGRNS
jgi:hypothetical protein